MTVFNIIFYLAAAIVISATGLAITRQSAVHAVCYLVISFMGTAVMFYILGAPLLAALEVIIYAGGIMVLFLFVVMMVKDQQSPVDKPSRIKTMASGHDSGGNQRGHGRAARFRRSRKPAAPAGRDGHAAGVRQDCCFRSTGFRSKSLPCCFLRP